ncbi:MAG: TonB-dependent siderophore receptor [Curvibacter sp. PD_MW3]|nr:MAG: TonB-dependent siderophore receptor [Curvibacter sp. PD_MW3]
MRSCASLALVFRRQPLAVLVAALCASGAQAADASADKEVNLGTVTVTGNSDYQPPTEGTGLYTTRKSSSATGLKLSLKETPQTVSVVSRSQMDDFGLNSVNDALAVTSGIRVEKVETDRTYYTARGFDVTNFQIDGVGLPMMYGNVYGDLDTALYDRIDVVYGANGLSTASGYPSATVNFVRKRTLGDFAAKAAIKVGSWNRVRFDGDINTKLNEDGSVRARIVVAKEKGDSYLDRYKQDKTLFYGVIEADLDNGTQLALGHTWQESKSTAAMWGTLPMLYSNGTRTNYDISTSSAADWTYWNNTTSNTFAELSRELGEGWKGKVTFTHTERTSRGALYYLSGQPSPATGTGLSSFSSLFATDSREDTLNLTADGSYTLAGRKHELNVGMSAGLAKHRDASYYTVTGGAANPPAVDLDRWDGSTNTPVFASTPGGSADFKQSVYTAHAATRLNLSDDLHLIGGVRQTSYDQDGTSYGEGRRASHARATWYGGATYDLTKDQALYASYAEIFNPQYQIDVNRQILKPVEGNSAEIGFKQELQGGKGNASVALFRSEQNNLADAGGNFADGTAYYRGINAIAQGLQADVTGQLSERLQAGLGYTTMTIKDPAGNEARTFMPRQMLRLSATYRVPGLEQLKVGGNLSWQDDTYARYQGSEIRQKAYALLNLMARYDISKKVYATMNLNNATNEKYLNSLYWGSWGQGFYGAPRNASVALNWTY